jgi:hypothetical protein
MRRRLFLSALCLLLVTVGWLEAAEGSLVWRDDFATWDSASWPVRTGSKWQVEAGRLQFAEDWSLLAGGKELADTAVEAEVELTQPAQWEWGGLGLLVRHSGRNAYWFRLIHSGTRRHICIHKLIDMQVSELAGKGFDPGTGRPLRLRAVVRGKRLQFYVDDRLQLEAVDPDPLPAGRVGMLVQMAGAFDWIAQTDLTPRQLSSQRVAAAPQIDGRLDDPCWEALPPTTGFLELNSEKLAADQTVVRLGHDDRALYVAVECLVQDPARLPEAARVRNERGVESDFWKDGDHLEIFLDPDRDRQTYFHVAVKATGAQFDEIGLNPDWDGEWTARCAVGPDRWVAEIALPFAGLGLHPGVGQTWGLNIARGNSALWQTGPSFHRPDLFGDLTGLDVDFSRYCVQVTAVPDPAIVGANRMALAVDNLTGQAQTWQVGLELRAAAGRAIPVAAPAPVAILPQARSSHDFTFAIDSAGAYRWRPVVTAPATGEIVHLGPWQRLETLPFLQVELGTCRHRSTFYPEQRSEPFTVDVQANLDHERLAGAQLEVSLGPRDQPETVVATCRLPTVTRGVQRCALGNVDLAPGNYRVRATLRDGAGTTLATAEADLVSVPAAAATVRVRDDGTVMVHGQPFFPLGVFNAPDAEFARLRQAGFNTIQSYGPCWWPHDQVRTFLDTAHAAGLMVTFSLKDLTTRFGPKPAWYSTTALAPEEQAAIRGYVEEFRDHPAVLDWYIADEPEVQVSMEKVRQAAELIATLDPYHPHSAAFCQRAPVSEYWPVLDVLLPDMYPFPQQPLDLVGEAARDAIRRSHGRRTVWLIAQSCQLEAKYLDGRRGRPNYEEMRCMAWQALVAGVNGLYFYDWGGHAVAAEERELLRGELLRVVGEIAPLLPVLLAPRSHAGFEVQVDTGALQWATRTTAEATYLFVVNPRADPGRFRVTWAEATAPGELADAFSGETQPAAAAGISVELGGYGVRGYRFGPPR